MAIEIDWLVYGRFPAIDRPQAHVRCPADAPALVERVHFPAAAPHARGPSALLLEKMEVARLDT
ncbi:MAG TPA: hypothetical protein VIJ79_03700 [Acidobacteriaceae bacterium]